MAHPPDRLGRHLRDAALLHRSGPPAHDRSAIRSLPAGAALVHAGLLHELLRAHRPLPHHPARRPLRPLEPAAHPAGHGERPPALPLRAAARPGAPPARRPSVAGRRALLPGQRHALCAGRRRGGRHPDDGRLVPRRGGPQGAGAQPHRGRAAEPQEPVEPPLPLQHAQQHLLAHPARHDPCPAGRPRPEPHAALRALRQQPRHRPARGRD